MAEPNIAFEVIENVVSRELSGESEHGLLTRATTSHEITCTTEITNRNMYLMWDIIRFSTGNKTVTSNSGEKTVLGRMTNLLNAGGPKTSTNTQGISMEGDKFPYSEDDQELTNLFCVRRELLFSSPKVCMMTCHWQYINTKLNGKSGELPILMVPTGGLRQATSQTDRSGELIKVKHYQAGYPTTQIAEVSVLEPYCGFRQDVMVRTDKPFHVMGYYLGKINKESWRFSGRGTGQGDDKHKWMCLSALPRQLNANRKYSREFPGASEEKDKKPQWIFGFEFGYNPKGWEPTVAWRSPGEGRPPDGLVKGDNQGYFDVHYYDEADFNTEPQAVSNSL